jgi:outer membrane lipopolysaccharide assembly protein LptE/RlpB
MKKYITGLFLITILFLISTGCGYHFPAVATYDGPGKTLYINHWQNRTSELGIDATLYKSLSGQFQQSEAITVTRNKEQADLILAGEITSIELPSAAWGNDAATTDIKVRLVVRYVLKDLKTRELLLEVPSETWTEDYASRMGTTGENKALNTIINDLSERIYLSTLTGLQQQNTR